MKLSEFKSHLQTIDHLQFLLPSGMPIPAHFHITEAGTTTKHFVDCGGKERIEKTVSFQIWVAGDIDHRLAPSKLLRILDIAQPQMGIDDLEIDVEYQQETISRFGIDFNGTQFTFTPKFTNCLADDHCGIPEEKRKVSLSDLIVQPAASACTPGGGCC